MAKEKLGRDLKGYLSSRSAYRWQELCTGVVTEHGKQSCNENRKGTSEKLVRSKSRNVQGCGG
jgi:hypothetical protein